MSPPTASRGDGAGQSPRSDAARVWADAVVADLGADRFHRASFVVAVSHVLRDVLASEDSIVAALVGPWGSGKSSTLGFILDELGTSSVVPLNPWMVTGPDGVAQEVVTAVTSAVVATGAQPEVVTAATTYLRALVRSAIKGAAAVGGAYAESQGVVLGTELGAAVGDAATGLLDVRERRADTATPGPTTLQQAADALAQVMRGQQSGVLVVIDDVDRLQPEELLALFKAVRLLGRLPHVHYLLAYDEETLLDLLAQTPVARGRRDRALAYLEKIVPLKLEQPEVTEDHVDDLLAEGYARVVAASGAGQRADDDAAFAVESELLLRRLLTTPRAVHRFYAQLELVLGLVGADHVDTTDLAVLTLLRLHHPQLYRMLSAERGILTDQHQVDVDGGEWETRVAPALRRPGHVLEREWQPVIDAVSRLFPRSSGAAVDPVSLLEPGRRQRARDADYVDRYFALSPLAGDVARVDVARSLTALAGGTPASDADPFLDVLLTRPVDRRAAVAARRLLRRATEHLVAEPPSPETAAALVVAFCRLAPFPQVGAAATDQPALVLVGHLLHRVGAGRDPDWAALVQRLVSAGPLRPGHHTTTGDALWMAVRACSFGVPIAHRADVEGLLAYLADATWHHVQASARDAQADVPPGDLGPWLVRVSEPFEVERQIDRAWEGGADLADLVSRLLPLKPSGSADGSGAYVLAEDPDVTTAVVEAVFSTASADDVRSRLVDAPQGSGPAVERRRAAREVLLSRAGRLFRPLPKGVLKRTTLHGSTAYESVVPAPPLTPDLRLVMTVAAPAAPLPLLDLGDEPDRVATMGWVDRWEASVEDALDGSPSAAWLRTGHPSAVVREGTSWNPQATRGRWISFSADHPLEAPDPDLLLRDDAALAAGQRQLFVQVLTGLVAVPGTDVPVTGAAAVVSLGLRLPRRREVERLTDDRQLAYSGQVEPAPLQDLATMVLAAVRSASLAGHACAAIPRAPGSAEGPGRSAVVHLSLTCSDDLPRRVSLDLPGRKSSTSSSRFHYSAVTEDAWALRSAGLDSPAAHFTGELLASWLRDAEYREGVDRAVDAAVRSSGSEGASASTAGT